MSNFRRNLPWLLFPILSGADLFLTWRLLGQGSFGVYESNPVAAWCLHRFGWAGLALFKAAAVVLVLAATAALYRKSPHVGARVLTFACTVLSVVVTYSFLLSGPVQALQDSARMAVAIDGEIARRPIYPVQVRHCQQAAPGRFDAGIYADVDE